MKLVALFGLLFILFLPFAFASSSFQYSKIYLNPFYRSSMAQNTNYTYVLSFYPPDGLEKVDTALINFQIYITPTVEFFLYVNDKPCNNPSYLIHTTYMDAGYADISFDCSNVITKAGNYTITLRPTQANTGAVRGWAEITYKNNPLSMSTGATEYQAGDNGRIFLRLVDGNSRPVNLGECNTSVYYPNNTKFIDKQPMILLEDGYYYYDFVVPNEIGVYITGFDCKVPSRYFTQTLFGQKITGGSCTNIRFDFDNSNNLTIIQSNLTIVKSSGEGFNAYFNNIYLGSGSSSGSYTYELNQSHFIITDSQVVSICSSGSTNIESLTLNVLFDSNFPTQIIRGQSEIHVNLPYKINDTNIIDSINNINISFNGSINVTFDYDWLDMKFMNVSSQIESVNQTIKDVNQSLSQEHQSILQAISNIPSQIWSFANRTLTSFDFIVEISNSSIFSILNPIFVRFDNVDNNITEISQNLYTINSSLITQMQDLSYSLEQLNLTNSQIYASIQDVLNEIANINNTVIYVNESFQQKIENISYAMQFVPKEVWEYPYRNLTYYENFSIDYSQQLQNISQQISSLQENITQEIYNLESRILQNTTLEFSSLNVKIGDTYAIIEDVYNNISIQLDNLNQSVYLYINQLQNNVTLSNQELLSFLIGVNNSVYLVNQSLALQIQDIMSELQNLNITSNVTVNATEIASYVWNYDNRTVLLDPYIINSLEELKNSTSQCCNSTAQKLDNILNEINNTKTIIYEINSTQYDIISQLNNLNASVINIYNSTNGLYAEIQNITIVTAEDIWTYEIRELTSAVNVSAGNISKVENALASFTDLRYAGATEYSQGETARISYLFYTTISGSPEPIINANCSLKIWYPDNTLFYQGNMSHLENGIYYANVSLGNAIGVYQTRSYCDNSTFKAYGSSTFHLAPWANKILMLSGDINVTYLDTYEKLRDFIIVWSNEGESNRYCYDNSTLAIDYVYNTTINGNMTSITKTKYYDCQNGCNSNTNSCNPKKTLNVWILGLFLELAVFLMFMKNRIVSILGSMLVLLMAIYMLQGVEIIEMQLIGTQISITWIDEAFRIFAYFLIVISILKILVNIIKIREAK